MRANQQTQEGRETIRESANESGPARDVVYTDTYRFLRVAMVVLLVMLVFSVGYEWWFGTGGSCWLGSISAYYYTPSHSVFVGSLCALGATLIAHKGRSSTEDMLLNFSGFMAIVVAMVPTVPDNSCGPNVFTEPSAETVLAVHNNIWSLIAVTVPVVIVVIVVMAAHEHTKRAALRGVKLGTWINLGLGVLGVLILLAELGAFLLLPDYFINLCHGIAASTMVVSIIAVMVCSALSVDRHSRKSGSRYWWIYVGLAVFLAFFLFVTVVVSLMVSGFEHVILITEGIVILLFGAYWIVQTLELWNPEPPEKVQERSRANGSDQVEGDRGDPGESLAVKQQQGPGDDGVVVQE